MNPNVIFDLLRPLSPAYGLAMRLRAAAYKRKILRSERLPVPVLSIGNLTWGGTGKTPLVIAIALRLQRLGLRPAVVSRGYGGQSRHRINVVADHHGLRMTTPEASDEAVLTAQALPGVPVLTGKVRPQVAWQAIRALRAQAIILDDGFQHLALHRDLDLVLFSSRALLGNGRVFPGGPLREPWSALARADAFVITGWEEHVGAAVARFERQLRADFRRQPLFTTQYLPSGAIDASGTPCLPEEIKGVPLFAFCGIANPGSFVRTLASLGFLIRGQEFFRDHHRYRQHDLDSLVHQARASGAAGLLTTQKDLVKLGKMQTHGLPLWALRMEVQEAEQLHCYVEERLLATCR